MESATLRREIVALFAEALEGGAGAASAYDAAFHRLTTYLFHKGLMKVRATGWPLNIEDVADAVQETLAVIWRRHAAGVVSGGADGVVNYAEAALVSGSGQIPSILEQVRRRRMPAVSLESPIAKLGHAPLVLGDTIKDPNAGPADSAELADLAAVAYRAWDEELERNSRHSEPVKAEVLAALRLYIRLRLYDAHGNPRKTALCRRIMLMNRAEGRHLEEVVADFPIELPAQPHLETCPVVTETEGHYRAEKRAFQFLQLVLHGEIAERHQNAIHQVFRRGLAELLDQIRARLEHRLGLFDLFAIQGWAAQLRRGGRGAAC